MKQIEIPVFDAPGRGRETAAADHQRRPLALAHLARQTGGDRINEEQALRLFLRQAGAIGRAMRQNAPCDQRKHAARRLMGAAETVGALAVAESASGVEAHPDAQARVDLLLADIDRTCDFINSLLR